MDNRDENSEADKEVKSREGSVSTSQENGVDCLYSGLQLAPPGCSVEVNPLYDPGRRLSCQPSQHGSSPALSPAASPADSPRRPRTRSLRQVNHSSGPLIE